MPKYDYEDLMAYLHETYGDDLRWVANYNTESYQYTFQHIRENLKNELKGIQLDHVIHRSLAVYNKHHAETVYPHLGNASHLVVDYERGTAFHLFLDAVRGLTIMLEPERSVELPAFIEECRDRIDPI